MQQHNFIKRLKCTLDYIENGGFTVLKMESEKYIENIE